MLSSIKEDDTLSIFLRKDFDEKRYISALLTEGGRVDDAQAMLKEVLTELDASVKEEAAHRAEELLDAAATVSDVLLEIGKLRENVTALKSAAENCRFKYIEGPRFELAQLQREWRNTLETLKLLKSSYTALVLYKKLKSAHENDEREDGAETGQARLPHMWHSSKEIHHLSTFKTSDVSLVRSWGLWAETLASKLRTECSNMLMAGQQVEATLGVLEDLDYAAVAVREAADATLASTTLVLHEALAKDVTDRASFSRCLVAWFDAVYRAAVVSWALQRAVEAVMKSRAETWLESPLDRLFDAMWSAALERGARELVLAKAQKRRTVEPLLLSEFPRLAGLAVQLCDRAAASRFALSDGSVLLTHVHAAFAPLQTSYLSGLSSRWTQNHVRPVAAALPRARDDLALSEALAVWLRSVVLELDRCAPDQLLTAKVRAALARSIELVGERAEAALRPAGYVVMGRSAMSSDTRRNVAVANSLERVADVFLDQLAGAPVIVDAAKELRSRADRVVARLFDDALDRLSEILIPGVMSAPYVADVPSDLTSSPFVPALSTALGQLRDSLLPALVPSETVSAQRRRLVSSLLSRFMLTATLRRGLSDTGTLMLTSDMGQIEAAVAVICAPRSTPAHATWRAFKPLLFRAPADIPAAPEAQSLPPAITLHRLIGLAPPDLPFPHERSGWTVAKYVAWVEAKSGREVWQAVALCLDQYSETVTARGDALFDPVFPLVQSFGTKFV